MGSRAGGVSLPIFAITVIIVAIVAGALGYYLKPAPSAAATPTQTPKPGEGLTFYFIGGAAGDPYDARLVKGATDAASLLGINLVYVHTDWSAQDVINKLKSAIAAKPNGIITLGHPGYDALKPLFEQARAAGIYLYLVDTDVPQLRADYAPLVGFAGPANIYKVGYDLAKEAVKRFGLKPGDRAAIVSGQCAEPARVLKAKGSADALNESGLMVDWVCHPPEVYGNPAAGTSYVVGYLNAHPDAKLMVFDGGGTTAYAEDYLKAAGKKPGEIIAVGYDLTPGSIKSLKDGYLQLIKEYQPYMQAYLAVINLYLTIKYQFSGLLLDTGAGYVDSSNVAYVEKLVEEGYR